MGPNMDQHLDSQQNELIMLTDNGSPISFVTNAIKQHIQKESPQVKWFQFNSDTKYRFYNNLDLEINGKIMLEMKSGSKECDVLLVNYQTHSLMGRNI